MKPSKVLLISIFISAVILVIVGGVTTSVMASQASKASNNAQSAAVQDAVRVYQQREVDYNNLIQQANRQIDQANSEIQNIQSQLKATELPPSQPAEITPAVVTPAVSADQAALIAGQVAGIGQTVQKTPELVNFQSKTAYEVIFEKGSIFVDSQSGEVLYNGTIPPTIDANKAVQIAEDYLKNNQVLQVDQVNIANTPLFRVIFKNGTIAYLDKNGQITEIHLPGVVVVKKSAPGASSGQSGGGSQGSGSSGGSTNTGGNHEDGGNQGSESD